MLHAGGEATDAHGEALDVVADGVDIVMEGVEFFAADHVARFLGDVLGGASCQTACGGTRLLQACAQGIGDLHADDVAKHPGEGQRPVGIETGGQGLQAARQLGVAGLIEWLGEQLADADQRSEKRARRLDSDADAVHLATIHASKGLQYPVVMLPFVCDRWLPRPDVLHFHRADRTRALDIGITSDEGRQERLDRAAAEESGESLRLLYVALTRAQSQVVTWWFPSAQSTGPSPLHRVLLGRTQGQAEVPPKHPVPGDETLQDRLADWERRGALRVEYVDRPTPVTMSQPQPVTDLSVRDFTRTVDDAWRRTSYTALTRPLDEVPRASAEDLVASEPEVTDRQDEGGPADLVVAGGADVAGGPDAAGAAGGEGHLPSPMAELPVGAGFGSLVHAVLEEADAQAEDLLGELRAHIEEQIIAWPVPDLDRDALAAALVEVIGTPLGPLAPGTRLRDVGARDRLCEMDFELPLGGGDDAPPPSDDGAVLGDLAALMREHLPADDPVLADGLGALVADAVVMALLQLRSTLRQLDGSVGAESSVRKLLGVRHRQAVAEFALQAAGTAGALEGPRAHEFLLTRCLSIAGGTEQILLSVAGERILGLPRG